MTPSDFAPVVLIGRQPERRTAAIGKAGIQPQ